MSNNTQIQKLHHNGYNTILNVGRTKDDKIYLDIKFYFTNECIDSGEIEITREEWNVINKNLNTESKLYRCPECGDIVTETEILKDIENGSFGMCFCRYGNGSRILVEYEPYNLNDNLSPPLTKEEIEYIQKLRMVNKNKLMYDFINKHEL